jgi:hypothetical protein
MNENTTRELDMNTRSVYIAVPGDALAMINVAWQKSRTRRDAAVSLISIGMEIKKQPHFAAKPWEAGQLMEGCEATG